MSTQVQTILVDQFRANLDMLVQQKLSRLRESVTVEMVTGKRAAFDQIGSVTAVERTTRHADTPIADTPHGRRWAIMRDFEVGDLVDDQDKVKMLADPSSDYALNFSHAMNRQLDDLVIEALVGTSVTGETGTGSETFPAGQRIGTGSVFTLSKIVTASETLRSAEVDPSDPITIVMNQRHVRNLLNQAAGTTFVPTITNADYNSVRALMTGEINTFVGMKFVMSERVPLVGAEMQAIAFTRSSLKLGIAKEIKTRIEERADKSFSTQVYACLTAGAVRMEALRVVSIVSTNS